jgi:TolB protein
MAIVGEAAAGEPEGTGREPIDTQAVVQSIKKGRSFVTSGPMIELAVGSGRPGDELRTQADPIQVHVAVRAAPWVDVRSLEMVVGGRTVVTIPIGERPTHLGPEGGTKEEAYARTLRYEGDVAVPAGPNSTWFIAVVRGERPLDDVLPFMPIPPLAFTNPVWIERVGSPRPVPRKR